LIADSDSKHSEYESMLLLVASTKQYWILRRKFLAQDLNHMGSWWSSNSHLKAWYKSNVSTTYPCHHS